MASPLLKRTSLRKRSAHRAAFLWLDATASCPPKKIAMLVAAGRGVVGDLDGGDEGFEARQPMVEGGFA